MTFSRCAIFLLRRLSFRWITSSTPSALSQEGVDAVVRRWLRASGHRPRNFPRRWTRWQVILSEQQSGLVCCTLCLFTSLPRGSGEICSLRLAAALALPICSLPSSTSSICLRSQLGLAFFFSFVGGCLASVAGPCIKASVLNVNDPETRGVALALQVWTAVDSAVWYLTR